MAALDERHEIGGWRGPQGLTSEPGSVGSLGTMPEPVDNRDQRAAIECCHQVGIA